MSYCTSTVLFNIQLPVLPLLARVWSTVYEVVMGVWNLGENQKHGLLFPRIPFHFYDKLYTQLTVHEYLLLQYKEHTPLR